MHFLPELRFWLLLSIALQPYPNTYDWGNLNNLIATYKIWSIHSPLIFNSIPLTNPIHLVCILRDYYLWLHLIIAF